MGEWACGHIPLGLRVELPWFLAAATPPSCHYQPGVITEQREDQHHALCSRASSREDKHHHLMLSEVGGQGRRTGRASPAYGPPRASWGVGNKCSSLTARGIDQSFEPKYSGRVIYAETWLWSAFLLVGCFLCSQQSCLHLVASVVVSRAPLNLRPVPVWVINPTVPTALGIKGSKDYISLDSLTVSSGLCCSWTWRLSSRTSMWWNFTTVRTETLPQQERWQCCQYTARRHHHFPCHLGEDLSRSSVMSHWISIFLISEMGDLKGISSLSTSTAATFIDRFCLLWHRD